MVLSKVSTQLAITPDSLPRSGKVRATIRRDLSGSCWHQGGRRVLLAGKDPMQVMGLARACRDPLLSRLVHAPPVWTRTAFDVKPISRGQLSTKTACFLQPRVSFLRHIVPFRSFSSRGADESFLLTRDRWTNLSLSLSHSFCFFFTLSKNRPQFLLIYNRCSKRGTRLRHIRRANEIYRSDTSAIVDGRSPAKLEKGESLVLFGHISPLPPPSTLLSRLEYLI